MTNFYVFLVCLGVVVMVFNATINNISVISWRSILLVEETGVPGENKNRPVHLSRAGFELTTLLVISTDYIGSYKANYHMITTTTTPVY